MERGSDKHGSQLDDEMKEESHSLETSGKESRVEGHKEKEDTGDPPLEGSGTSARPKGEGGGSSHPRPKDEPGSDTADR